MPRVAGFSNGLAIVGVAMLVGACAPGGSGTDSAEPLRFGSTSASDVAAPSPSDLPSSGSPSPSIAFTSAGEPCARVFNSDRCDALTAFAADQLGVPFPTVRAIGILPNPSPRQIDFAHRTFLSVRLDDGTTRPLIVSCPGIASATDPQCMPNPAVPLSGSSNGGYTDSPDGSTPLPSLEPAAVANARPHRIAELDIPITSLGRKTMTIGTALLANGVLRDRHAALKDPWPTDVHFADWISVEVTLAGTDVPLTNLYEAGWKPGVEEVVVTLTYDVVWFKPGATLSLVDILVR